MNFFRKIWCLFSPARFPRNIACRKTARIFSMPPSFRLRPDPTISAFYYHARCSLPEAYGAIERLYIASETMWNSDFVEYVHDGTICRHSILSNPAKMLMGLSSEFLLEGLIIRKDNSYLEKGVLNWSLRTHYLVLLVQMAGISG